MLLQLSKMLRSMVSGVKVHDVLLKVAHASLSLKYTAVAVQLLSRVLLFAAPQTAACQASLSFTVSLSLLKLMSIELMDDQGKQSEGRNFEEGKGDFKYKDNEIRKSMFSMVKWASRVAQTVKNLPAMWEAWV